MTEKSAVQTRVIRYDQKGKVVTDITIEHLTGKQYRTPKEKKENKIFAE